MSVFMEEDIISHRTNILVYTMVDHIPMKWDLGTCLSAPWIKEIRACNSSISRGFHFPRW